jgi:hypothetical protein
LTSDFPDFIWLANHHPGRRFSEKLLRFYRVDAAFCATGGGGKPSHTGRTISSVTCPAIRMQLPLKKQ